MKRSANSNVTLTLYIAILILSIGGYLVVKDYLQSGILNGPMVVLLVIGIVLTAVSFFSTKKK